MRSAARRQKDAIYEQFARIGRALASPRRLELLDLLIQGPRTVEVLARETHQSLANSSRHLLLLRAARLVESEKNGLFVTYRLAEAGVSDFFLAFRKLAEARLADLDRVRREYLRGHDHLEALGRQALLDRVWRGEAFVIDVRPPEEYRAGHIPGALSVPLRELESRLADLPADKEIVAYCRGPYCVLAVEAVEMLSARGFRAARLDEGVLEWRARGFAVEEGPGGER
jgi:rhodanese-related sulfurtransferase